MDGVFTIELMMPVWALLHGSETEADAPDLEAVCARGVRGWARPVWRCGGGGDGRREWDVNTWKAGVRAGLHKRGGQ